jgi:hypothetical protein
MGIGLSPVVGRIFRTIFSVLPLSGSSYQLDCGEGESGYGC